MDSPRKSPAKPALECISIEVVPTPEIQKRMSTIEQHLNEVCSIASEGKLNSDQKMKISNLCRKIGHNSSQMAVLYQSLKQKALQTSNSMAVLKEQCTLSEHISDLKQSIEESCTVKTPSFADKVKMGPSSFVQPSNLSSVAIYPKDKLKSSDETRHLVQKIIRPDQMKLQVCGVRKTRNGGVIISTENKQDIEKLKSAVQGSTSALIADEPYKRKPRLAVLGVPASMTEHEVFNCIYKQNLADKCPSISLESFLALIKLSHKSGKKDAASCNYIVEVPANIRKAICQSRLFINWTSCPVRDFTLVTRCYKCHQYGHAAKSCREAIPTCVHCGETGHSISECVKKTDPPKCATCTRFNKPNHHKTGDVECPAKKVAEQRYINSVDYECP